MREFPQFQPWHLGGDPVYTYAEAEHLMDDARQAQRDRARQSRAAAARPAGRQPRARGRRR